MPENVESLAPENNLYIFKTKDKKS